MESPSPKRVICYGDSNTWGQFPNPAWETTPPQKHESPWPKILQELLGPRFEIVNEGLCGRTLATEDVQRPHTCGIKNLGSILGTHDPADLVIVALGSNDTKKAYKPSAEKIATDLEQTIHFIRDKKARGFPLLKAPKVLVLAPPPVIDLHPNDPTRGVDTKVSCQLSRLFSKVAQANHCLFFDAARVISASPIDGVHWDSEAHESLAMTLECFILDHNFQDPQASYFTPFS